MGSEQTSHEKNALWLVSSRGRCRKHLCFFKIDYYHYRLSFLLVSSSFLKHIHTYRNAPMMQHSSLFTGNRSLDVGPVNMGGHWNSLLPSSRENNSQKFRIKQYSHVDHLCCWRCGKSSVSDTLYSIERLNRSHPQRV